MRANKTVSILVAALIITFVWPSFPKDLPRSRSKINTATESALVKGIATTKTSTEPVITQSVASEKTDPLPVIYASSTNPKSYTYCLRLLGVSAANYQEFSEEVKRIYEDPRGWSLNGAVRFTEVSDSCNYIVWLAASDLVSTFPSPACGWYYNCQTAGNVVVNFDRWMSATSSWTGTLPEYRAMVVNHETGHQLGFNHLYCQGTGQLAPVMQQQSISLQGCLFNAWPTTAEKEQLTARLRIKI